MSAANSSPIQRAPAPWTTKQTVYSFMTYVSPKKAIQLFSEKDFIYAPLEAQSSFADHKFEGGLGMIQIIRYTDTPAGPYDEMVVVPGSFKCERSDKTGSAKNSTNLRITRIYVSQKGTCWNGRQNWNIPKHLARFSFKELPNNALSISVFPYTQNQAGIEVSASDIPFFNATYKPMAYTLSFPMSTGIAKYIGLDLSVIQPPLPTGKGALGELPGTDEWCKFKPLIFSNKTSLGWWDLKQPVTEGDKSNVNVHENWWPGLGRWQFGIKMDNATGVFEVGEHWSA